ncbi:cardiolipin synthase [Dyella sp. A6]|uniref:cardiolipin synthase n=1 Tax=Dyella aluminiiresistens TaxID=3069105 RepID=UPI002E79E882|nr:cardiolipin synthase [Dyella sp. A6]
MNLPLLTLIIVLVHLAGLVAATHAVMHTRTPQGAFAWALGLALLPWLTLLPYLYLGRSRFHGYVDLHRRHRRQLDLARSEAIQPPQHILERYGALSTMLDTPFHPGQALRLLVDGGATFTAILAAIAQAEHSVLVQFFIIHDDGLGRRMQQALLKRAAAGVKVCVLYDGIGSYALPHRYVETLRAGGVAIHPFATQRRHNRFQVNFRNHRKIVVVDGAIGYVGGLNVGDEYLGQKPPLAPWRDTHMELRGPAVGELQRSFAEDWHWVTGTLPPLHTPPLGQGSAHTLIAATGPADRQESCSLFFVTAIQAARQRVWLTTPYFVPDSAVMAELRLAVFRGVDVRVLIPSIADHTTVFLSSTLHARDAVRAGIRMFRHHPGFMHQKVLLVDDDTAAVGSMNMDSRSFRLNFEASALNVDRGFAADVDAMLRNDFSHAVEFDESEYDHAPWRRRLAMHLARLCDPIL